MNQLLEQIYETGRVEGEIQLIPFQQLRLLIQVQSCTKSLKNTTWTRHLK